MSLSKTPDPHGLCPDGAAALEIIVDGLQRVILMFVELHSQQDLREISGGLEILRD